MTKERTPAPDADWSPFGALHGTMSKPDGQDHVQPSRADKAGWRPRVIEGGRGHQDAPVHAAGAADGNPVSVPTGEGPAVDVLDAAAADALAVLDAPQSPVEPVETLASAPPETAAGETTVPPAAAAVGAPEALAAAPETTPQTAPAPTQEADSTPHTPHPAPASPETPAPAQSPAQVAETPHSTPWLRTAVGWLNPYDILDQPLPPVSAIYEAAATTVTDRSGFDRVTEIGWVYAIGMPVTVACYTLAAAVQHKARGIGVGLTVLAWVLAADAAPVDTSVIWWWTALGYWVSTVFILPAVIQAKK